MVVSPPGEDDGSGSDCGSAAGSVTVSAFSGVSSLVFTSIQTSTLLGWVDQVVCHLCDVAYDPDVS